MPDCRGVVLCKIISIINLLLLNTHKQPNLYPVVSQSFQIDPLRIKKQFVEID